MKICLVGIGSIGMRHLRNLAKVLELRKIDFEIDAIRSSSRTLEDDVARLLHKSYFKIEDADDDYDIVFITNPTALHYETIKQMIKKTKHMFIEKPVFDDFHYDLSIIPKTGIYYVACPLRYTNVIRYMKTFVNEKRIFSARIICSTYLPGWRPGTDYRETYSAKRELGGGVSIDLIHEIDYMSYLFGIPNGIENMRGTYSNLEIDSDDLSLYIAKYQDKLVSIHLDYFGRFPKREIEIFTDEDSIIGDLTNSRIILQKENKVIDLSESRDDYQVREIETFLDMVEGKICNHNDIFYANEILKIAKGGIV